MNGSGSSLYKTYGELSKALPAMRKPVSLLYESGAVRPGEPPKPAAKGGRGSPGASNVGSALGGTLDDLLARSACTDREFRKAAADGDRAFLEGLTGRLVIWRVMLVERAQQAEGRAVAKVMAGGASYAAEFPPDSEAAALLPGASVVMAGELREAKGAWTLHVTAWGLKKSIDSGEPMTRCEWPKPDAAARGAGSGK